VPWHSALLGPRAELRGAPKVLVAWFDCDPKPDPLPNKPPPEEPCVPPKAGLLAAPKSPPDVLPVLLPPNPPKVEVLALGVVLNNPPLEVAPVPKAGLLAPKGVEFEPVVPNVEPERSIVVSDEMRTPSGRT